MSTVQEITEASTSKFVQAGDIKVHYNEAGTGQPVIMLHGGGPGASGWGNFGRNFGPLAKRFRVLLIDHPNFGKTDSVVINEPQPQYYARVIRDTMEALGIEKAHLIGNSMGGGTTLKMAIDWPERVDKIVIVSPSGGGESIFTPQPSEHRRVITDVLKNPTAEGMKRLMNLVVYEGMELSDEELRVRLEAATKPSHLEARRQSTGSAGNVLSELSKIQAKTLIVWGRDDRAVPLDVSLRFLWGIQDSRLHVFSRCSHWPQFEHAAEFNNLVKDFLNS